MVATAFTPPQHISYNKNDVLDTSIERFKEIKKRVIGP